MRFLKSALLSLLVLASICAIAPAQAQQANKSVVASATHGAATATAAHVFNNTVVIVTGASFSCATTPGSPILAQIKEGTTVVWQQHITGGQSFQFGNGIAGAPGDDMSGVLPDCGVGVLGSVTLIYQLR